MLAPEFAEDQALAYNTSLAQGRDRKEVGLAAAKLEALEADRLVREGPDRVQRPWTSRRLDIGQC